MPSLLGIALTVALAVLVAPGYAASAGPIKIVATLPILKEFAEQVGGRHVEVRALISGLESEHSYSPKPGDLKTLGRARLLFEVGLGLEVWVSGLIKSADNPELQVITTSRHIALIRDQSSDHASLGNPHIWLDPENAKVMTRHIADGLIAADPAHKDDYLSNLTAYLQRLDLTQKDLQARVATLRDRRIVTHHPAWPYFARRFGFQIEDNILHQIGGEPSAARLAALARRIKASKLKVIVSEPQLNQKVAHALAEETGARVVVLSPLPGAIKGTESYLALLEYNVTQLVAALRS
jgi:ABC-type Zn uptake system ZnuABC Zn-binding protein ZnuA